MIVKRARRPRSVEVFAIAVALLSSMVVIGGCQQPSENSPARNASQRVIDPAVPPPPVVTRAEAVKFVGSEACRGCHPAQFNDHAGSLHSDTIRTIENSPTRKYFRTGQRIKDEALGVEYSFRLDGETPVCRVERQRDKAVEELSPKYVIGSGRFGHTYIFEKGGKFMESRLSFYPELKRWDWTPGQQEQTRFRAPMGAVQEPMSALSCFACHSTMLVREGEQLHPELSRLNVGCERCHGPGREHIAQAKLNKKPGAIYGYKSISSATEMRLCGECHREPGAIPDAELETHPDLPRFAGTALGASRCFRESNGKLKCGTCHNPHQTVSRDVPAYEKTCRGCHGEVGSGAVSPREGGTVCPVNAKSGCLGCHMRAEAMGPPVPELKFTNHWIRIIKDLDASSKPH